MTSAALRLSAPTQAERGLLRLADRLTEYVEHRISRRTQRREVALDLLREQQSRRHDGTAVDHLLAQMGVSRR